MSSTLACNFPLTSRLDGATCVAGAAPASLRLNSLKLLLCATMIRLASAGAVVVDCASVGSVTIAPALMRFTLSPMNASGLARNMATSIWSRETLASLLAVAMRPAVSPGLTTTCCASALFVWTGTLGAGLGLAAAAGRAFGSVASGTTLDWTGACAGGRAGAGACAGVMLVTAVALMPGGSNSMV